MSSDAPKPPSPRVSMYYYRDLPCGRRLHHWLPSGKFAIGNGPIKYISREEAEALLTAAIAAAEGE